MKRSIFGETKNEKYSEKSEQSLKSAMLDGACALCTILTLSFKRNNKVCRKSKLSK